MTTLAEFAAVLARVAARGVAPTLSVSPTGRDEACGLVLDAVGTCLLPRLLTVTAAGAPCVEFAAAGGRMLSVSALGNRAGQEAFGDLVGRPLRAEDAGRLAELLRAVLPDDARLDIGLRPGQAAEGGGIAPAAVLEALDLRWDILEPADRLQHLQAATEEVLIAVRTSDRQTRVMRKDADPSGELVGVLDGCLHENGLASMLAADEMLLLSDPDGSQVTVGLLHCEDGPEAMVFDPEVAGEIAALWTELVRPALVEV